MLEAAAGTADTTRIGYRYINKPKYNTRYGCHTIYEVAQSERKTCDEAKNILSLLLGIIFLFSIRRTFIITRKIAGLFAP